MNLRKGELTPPQKSEVFSTRSGGLLQEQDYIGSSFSSQEGNHCSRECVPDLNLGGMELRLAPPQAVELAQESVKDEAFYGSGAGHFHQEPGSKDKGVCFEQISCREKLTTLPTSNIRLEAEKTLPTDSMNVVPEKLSTEIDRKQKQAAELFSRSIVSEKQTVGDSRAGSNFWHAQKLQHQQMAVTPELTPFHLALRAQQQTELSRHGWGGAFNGLAWSQVFIPGVQEQDNKGIPQMLVYGGYGHQVEVSNVAPSPLSQASGILAGNAHTKELEKQQTPKMLTSSTYYISEQSTTASGPLYLGSQLQGKMAGNTGYGTIDPKLWPNSSIQLTAEADYCVRSSHATVKEKTANASSPPVVGWPPVQSFRKNSAVAHCQSKPPNQCQALPLAGTSSLPSPSPPDGGVSSLFVKVYMDGVPIGRKVDLKANSSYEKLSLALEEMFEQFVIGHCVQEKFLSKREKLSPSSDKKPSFLHGSDYVMTYEDKDGDLMLVGDVPWSLFARTVKRLRIMKGCEAIGFDRAKEKAMN